MMKKKTENENQEIRRCKKCQKPLPENYKFDKCENCRGKMIETVKKTVIGGGSALLGVGLLIITGGKIGGKKS